MKQLKKLGILVLLMMVGSFSSFSCKSDDDGGSGGSAAEGTIYAKVNGQGVTTLTMTTAANRVGSTLTIQGNTGGTSSKAFMMLINGINGVGTYPIGGGANISVSASYTEIVVDMSNPMNSQTTTWQAPYDSSEAGEIKISELTDDRVKGTFRFTGKNVNGDNSTREITEGSFNIKVTNH